MNLLEVLEKSQPARVVVVSSNLHKNGNLQFDDLDWEKREFASIQVYGDSKIANIYFASELNRKFKEAKLKITAVSLHPGIIQTSRMCF